MNMNQNDKAFIAEQIRTQYIEKQPSDLDALKALDRKVHRPVEIRAYTLGCIVALIMGAGMSLVMTDIGATLGIEQPMVPGIIIGVIGLVGAGLNYVLYAKSLAKRKKKYAEEILALSKKCLDD